MIAKKNKDDVNLRSKKIESFVMPKVKYEPLMLPRQRFEPFFMKAIRDFKVHHNISEDIPPPQKSMTPDKLLSYILDLMSYSMGEEKRNALLVELNEYKQGLPFDLR